MILAVLILYGLCFGSFTNAFVFRLHKQRDYLQPDVIVRRWLSHKRGKHAPNKYSITTGRSMCPHCEHVLGPLDLVPVLSWLLLRGKCRYCGKPIPDTPLPEIILPILFAVSYLAWPWPLAGIEIARFIVWLIILTIAVSLLLFDLRWFLLPDILVWPFIALAALFFVLGVAGNGHTTAQLAQVIVSLILMPGMFWLLYTASHGTWIGGGDVKLAIALTLLVVTPFASVLLLFTASVTGLLASVLFMRFTALRMTSKIPFGPFLLLGAFVAILGNGTIEHWLVGSL